jgi:hypothetical protein
VRLVDLDAVIDCLEVEWGYEGIRKDLYSLPVVDAVPVVRCTDCKYGSYDSKPNGAMVCLRTNDGFWRKETDFCSYGTPKNDGGET